MTVFPGCGAEAELAGYAAKGFTAAKMRVVIRDGFSIAKCVRRYAYALSSARLVQPTLYCCADGTADRAISPSRPA